MKEAYVQVYTGNGKGKTSAAIGLTIRALGAGLSVFFGQFIKGMRYSEIEVLETLSSVLGKNRLVIKQFGRGCFIIRDPEQEDIDAAKEGLMEAKRAMLSKSFDLLILDELNVAIKTGLLSEAEVIDLIDSRPSTVELVITGRYATDAVIEKADLVTEMKPVRHYYDKGVEARNGIER